MPTVWDIRRSALRRYKQLISLPNVCFFTIGKKWVAGRQTDEMALVAYVKKKQARLQKPDRVPESLSCIAKNGTELGAVRTDVRLAANTPLAFGIRSGQVITGYDNQTGVCAIAYTNPSGEKRLMTNAHVVVDVAKAGETGTPYFLNRVDNLEYPLGEVRGVSKLRAGRTTTHDVAVIHVPGAYNIDEFMIQDINSDAITTIEGLSTNASHDYWFRINGNTFRCGNPERVVGAVDILVDGVVVRYSEFWVLRMTQGSARKGQSGALLCRHTPTGIAASGLVFGGIDPNSIFAFPFNKMWNKFSRF
ncbi:hypothetical protein [Roseibium sp.]|uniref:hypothetical protein n=1 Tax=Roseibium sp. TaxID=1936156 RepID=UPI00391C6CB5